MTFLYVSTTGRLNDTKQTLASRQTNFEAARKQVTNLNGKLAQTASSLKTTKGALANAQSDLGASRADLKTAYVCLKGLYDIGSTSSGIERFQILLRVNDECKSAYRGVQDSLPG